MTRILADVKLDFQDVLIVPKRSELSSRSEVVLERTYKFKNSGQTWTGIGIIASNMDGVGTLGMASALAPEKMLTALVKHYSNIALEPVFTDPNTKNNVIFSIGSSDSDYQKYKAFTKTVCQPLFLMVDVANGYSQKFIDFISKVRDENPTVVLIAGNVATPEMAEQLILSGADMAKIGIGAGNACSTRIKAGVGYPQLSAVLETSDAIHGLGGHVISDGGITCPGDVAKAFAAGSDMVMMGSYLAGTTEGLSDCIPKYIYENNKPVAVEFYGMSSRTAQEAHGGSLSDYRASEGRVLHVPLKGSVSPLIQDLLGSLRSTCTYSGARTLKELPKRATFCQVHRQISTIYGVGKLME